MIDIRPLTSESHVDRADALRIFMEAPSYVELHESRSPSEADVDDLFFGAPPKTDISQKSVFGCYVGPDMVGCIDLIRSYPTSDCAWIGLLLFSELHRNRGYGKAALASVMALALEWDCSRIQLATLSTNLRGIAFWQREGFTELRRAHNPRFPAELIVMERRIR
ncbi:GNAT family N-acetyltransferase [Paraburkholderia sp. BCC1885]|uniref:GNAT family N-acetyltransferase n=1 Tax=Paraburkholderia sp. BCC1885 TaxID=2562669 RepID=UPI00164271FE|nr:GNAT family N-acetyltransferase [Paraburkholderia sp. BCC1885]